MTAFTSKDVARLAGVSQSTVSYVMSGKRPISEETRRRVHEAIDRLTYQPNAGARALASQRTNVVGLVAPFGPSADSAGLLPFIESIASSARAQDYEVLLVTSDEGSAGLRRLAGRSLCDGILMMDIRTEDERVPVAAALRTPVILIGVPADPQGLHCVDMDFALAARLAVGELVDTGHDRIVILQHPSEVVQRDLNYVHRFLDPAIAAAADRRLRCEVTDPVERGKVGVIQAVERILADRVPGERLGLVVPNANAVSPVLQALIARGVLPGRDLSVIGVCMDAWAENCEPAVTNVSGEARDVSRRAMETLFWLLEPTPVGPPPAVDLIEPRLTRRESVMAPP